MNKLYLLSLKSFIEQSAPKDAQSLYKFLREDVQAELKDLKEQVKIPLSFIISSEALANIHYSWFKPLIDSLEPMEASCYISSLPSNIKGPLNTILNTKAQLLELPTLAKKFFLERFFLKFIEKTPFLPQEFLPQRAINDILSLKKTYFVWLIDLLGIQDLSLDLRKVLDKRILEDILSKLDDHQKKYLTSILNRGDLPFIKSEELTYWQKSKEVLLNQIHQKGLLRLSIALKDEDENLVWHISRLLDIGRGSELIKNLQDTRLKAITPKLKEQITSNLLSLLNLFKDSK